MLTEIVMPKMSDTMEEGTVVRWLKGRGDPVEEGEPVAEVSTEKADVDIVSPADGYLSNQAHAEGDVVAVGGALGYVSDTPVSGDEEVEAGRVEPDDIEADQVATRAQHPSDDSAIADSDRSRALNEAGHDQSERALHRGQTPARRVVTSPLARKMAVEADMDLSEVGEGSGPGGRVLRVDVERAIAARSPVRTEVMTTAEVGTSRLHREMAKRTAQSWQEVPHFYLTNRVDFTECNNLLKRLQAGHPDVALSVTHLAIRALALALREAPSMNSSWRDNQLVIHPNVNIGVAVATDSGDLLVPVVRDADQLSVVGIARVVGELADRSRSHQHSLEDISGATITVTNLGMYGVDTVAPLVNSPQGAILGLGAISLEPAALDGEVVLRERGAVTLSVDHRAASGAVAASFLRLVETLLTEPYGLVE